MAAEEFFEGMDTKAEAEKIRDEFAFDSEASGNSQGLSAARRAAEELFSRWAEDDSDAKKGE